MSITRIFRRSLVTAAAVTVCSTGVHASADVPAITRLAPPAKGLYLGVWNPAVASSADGVTRWNTKLSLRLRLVGTVQHWGNGAAEFDAASMTRIARQGGVPVVGWEPWRKPAGSLHSASQPKYRLSSIARGDFDAYVKRWAAAAAAYGQPIVLRPMHEMNGTWYPWSIHRNGNSAPDFILAWRRMHRIFQRAGATNVSWAWIINTLSGYTPNATNLTAYYPGRRYVDWVGLTGFNWGNTMSWSSWRGVDEILAASYRLLRKLDRPIMISEFGTVPGPRSGGAWMAQTARRVVASYPRVKAVMWWDDRWSNKVDFRLRGSIAGAFSRAIRSTPAWAAPLRFVTPSRTPPTPPASSLHASRVPSGARG